LTKKAFWELVCEVYPGSLKGSKPKRAIEYLFTQYDANGDGLLEYEEARKILSQITHKEKAKKKVKTSF